MSILQEILTIVILIFYLNCPASTCPLFALIYCEFLALLLLKSLLLLKVYDETNKTSSINTSSTNHSLI